MRTVVVDGAELAYDVRGDGPVVVFVHGTGTHRLTFEPVLDALPSGHAVVTYDRRGFGASRGPLARRMGEHTADLEALVRSVSAAPVTIVAQSGGAVSALELAASRPELIGQLVLAEPVVQVARVPSLALLRALAGVQVCRLTGRKTDAVVRFYRWSSGRRDGTNSYDLCPDEWRRVAEEHAGAVFRELRQMMVPRPSTRAIRAVACPVTLIIGDVGQPVFHRTTRLVARLLPDANVVHIADSGHLIAMDQPTALATAIADLIAT